MNYFYKKDGVRNMFRWLGLSLCDYSQTGDPVCLCTYLLKYIHDDVDR
jgi:hypothetical protein